MNIEFTKSAFKEYNELPLNYKDIVDETLARFVGGVPIDIKPIKGEIDTYRIRVGKYRLLLIKINPDYLIVKIGNRKDIYR